MLFDAKISAAYSGLTYSQRKVANYVQEKYEDVAFETLEKLAAKAGVSTTTVIRFSRALGYSGYSEMQEDIKKEIQTKGSLPDRLEHAAAVSDNDLLSDTFTTDINNLNQTFAGLQPDELEAAIRLISGAKNIYVLGMRSSFSLAHYMVSRLGEIKKNVHFVQLTGLIYPEEIVSADVGDVCIAYMAGYLCFFTIDQSASPYILFRVWQDLPAKCSSSRMTCHRRKVETTIDTVLLRSRCHMEPSQLNFEALTFVSRKDLSAIAYLMRQTIQSAEKKAFG